MAAGNRVGFGIVACALVLAAVQVHAQSVTLSEPPVQLLPQSFDGWQKTPNAPATPDITPSLTTLSKQALQECGPLRSQVDGYRQGGRAMRVEAIEFGDRTGAYSAFTLAVRPDMKTAKDLGSSDAVGDGAVLFTLGDTLVLAAPASNADLQALRQLAKALPKVTGSQGVAPLLPSFVPDENLVPSGLRYALGPATYAAEGGVLPANSLGWDKSAEAVTASYRERKGNETLTLLIYPTPQIAEAFERRLSTGVKQLGPNFANARVRRENELVMLASGALPGSDAQTMLDKVHMKQEVTIDRDMPPVFHVEVQKTISLLTSIAVLAGVLMGAAVLLGLFLGGGRALIRVMQGKPAASEPEFLSLHLAPQNPTPHWEQPGPNARP
ncbi:MAG TPA: DUF6599 family protein [Candidatus Aquilonibacter sp.]|nr:DUF6599 family protein [Candidatus Aquilonibacter sp.]